MSRAVAVRDGVDPARLGSFKDELLREMDRRQRNCRLAEITLFLKTLLLVTGADQKHAILVDEWVEQYEAELYQDVYTPEHEMKERAALQRKRAKEKEEAKEKARLLKMVANMG